MNRYVVYRDISGGWVIVDTLADSVLALYDNRGNAERAAGRLNDSPLTGDNA